ncbi:MAG: hypothetical protein KAS59_09625, partial [Alphaproteobacteria bacterium]|nr:hypothetical protein [Alphaproteobacteria bacterium]
DTIVNIENITGTTGADTITGDSAANILLGGDGNDTVDGSTGSDTLNGGEGNDTLDYSGSSSGITGGQLTSSSGTFVFGGDTDTVSNFENFTLTSYDDSISFDTATIGQISSVDGGANTDTLAITGTGAQDLTNTSIEGSTLASLFTNIEQLDLTNTDVSGGDKFSIGDNDIQSISGSGTLLNIYTNVATISLTDIEVLDQLGSVIGDNTVGNIRTVDWDNSVQLVITAS